MPKGTVCSRLVAARAALREALTSAAVVPQTRPRVRRLPVAGGRRERPARHAICHRGLLASLEAPPAKERFHERLWERIDASAEAASTLCWNPSRRRRRGSASTSGCGSGSRPPSPAGRSGRRARDAGCSGGRGSPPRRSPRPPSPSGWRCRWSAGRWAANGASLAVRRRRSRRSSRTSGSGSTRARSLSAVFTYQRAGAPVVSCARRGDQRRPREDDGDRRRGRLLAVPARRRDAGGHAGAPRRGDQHARRDAHRGLELRGRRDGRARASIWPPDRRTPPAAGSSRWSTRGR